MSDHLTVSEHINSIGQFIDANRAHMSEQTMMQTVAGLVRSLKVVIQKLPKLALQDATALSSMVSTCNFLDDKCKAELLQAISLKHLEILVSNGETHNKQQSLRQPCRIFTASDWAVFDDTTKSKPQKLATCINRLASLGVTNMHEKPTVQHLASMLTCVIYPGGLPPKDETYRIVTELKDGVKAASATVPKSMTRLIDYPDDPNDLPDDIKARAYSTEGPIDRVVDRYAEMLGYVKLRRDKESKQCRGSSANMGQQLMSQLLQGFASHTKRHSSEELPPWLSLCTGGGKPNSPTDSPDSQQSYQQHAQPPSMFTMSPDNGQHAASRLALPPPTGWHPTSQTLLSAPSDLQSTWQSLQQQRSTEFHSPMGSCETAAAASVSTKPALCDVTADKVFAPVSKGKSVAELEEIAKGKFKTPVKRRLMCKQPMPAAYQHKVATRGRPKGSTKGAGKGVAKAAAAKPKIARAAAHTAIGHASRPPVPALEMGHGATKFLTGRVLVSIPGQCFRVFKKHGDRVDHKKVWKRFDSIQACWDASLDMIAEAHAA